MTALSKIVDISDNGIGIDGEKLEKEEALAFLSFCYATNLER